MTQRECQCVMDASVTLTSRTVGVGWCVMCGLGLELVVRLHEVIELLYHHFRSLSGQLIGIQTSLVQGTAFWIFFVQATGHETSQFVHHNLIVYSQEQEMLGFLVDLTYMVAHTLC